jgi:hypothetical protein
MLNDLLAIERGMTGHGVDLVGRHPDVKDMARGGTLRVRLDAGGRIAGIEIVAEAGRGAVWTLRDGQHNGFPGLKTASGLLLLDADARRAHEKIWGNDKTTVSRRNELLRLLEAHSLDSAQVATWPNMGHRKRIAERVHQLAALRDDPLTASVPAAFERFLLALGASPSFVEGLLAGIGEYVRTGGDEWLEPARMAFLGPIALMIDVVDTDFQRDAGDMRQIGPISASLGGFTSNADPRTGDNGNCALTGKAAKLHVGNFPQPNLPGLGQTYLFARNRDIPSLIRYGRTADAAFAIDADLVGRLSGAITALTREETRGRSWRLIPAETGDKPDLLIASLPAAPDVKLADFIADDDDFRGESAFFELTSRVLDQSQVIYEHDHPQDEVIVLVLRAVDPANRKTIYQRRAKAVVFFEAAERWKQMTSNTPDWLGFQMPVRDKRGLVFRKPPYVAPLSVVPLSRTQFANGGRRRVDVIGVTVATAFGMFLHEGDFGQSARTVLRLLVQRHGALLAGLAQARSKGIGHLKDFDPKTDLRRDALQSATWLGALLYYLGRTKEDYMSDAAFRLGQLLAAVDVIHIGYCADLRGGDVPPTLLGNSIFSIAGSNPVKALAILRDRWKPYGAWARQTGRVSQKIDRLSKGEDSRLAWDMRRGLSNARRIGPIATELADSLRADDMALRKPGDQFRAELLLGYLAGLPPLPKNQGDASSSDDNDDLIDQNKGEDA